METNESKITWPMPDHLREAIHQLQAAVDNLSIAAGHQQKKFTLDGRLIGDLGEVIAAHYFDLILTDIQKTGFDATIASGPNRGEHVEVKCRRMSTRIVFDRIPKHLIVFKILPEDKEVELIYAGSGNVLKRIRTEAELSDDQKFQKQISVSTSQLAAQFDVTTLPNLAIPPRAGSILEFPLITAT